MAHTFLPAEAMLASDRQRLFLLFFTGTLIDLVVLGLFDDTHHRRVTAGIRTDPAAVIVGDVAAHRTALDPIARSRPEPRLITRD